MPLFRNVVRVMSGLALGTCRSNFKPVALNVFVCSSLCQESAICEQTNTQQHKSKTSANVHFVHVGDDNLFVNVKRLHNIETRRPRRHYTADV